jgi:hypothetical protein
VLQVLLEWAGSSILVVADHLQAKWGENKAQGTEPPPHIVSDETKPIEKITEVQREVIKFCTVPKSMTEIQVKIWER